MSSADLFEELLRIIAHLRDPQKGCPWDLKQTHQSLRPYVIEEAYEVVDAIDAVTSSGTSKLREELGDLLLQVVLHAQLGKDSGTFEISDVLGHLNKKLVDRHPHVFGEKRAKDADEAVKSWEQSKQRERSGSKESILSGIPASLPALLTAHRIGEKVARVGFDWDSAQAVKGKVLEELQEFLDADSAGQLTDHAREEMGDLLFSLAQYIRKRGWNSEDLLRDANSKFRRRFTALEMTAGDKLGTLSAAELEKIWGAVKESEK